MTLHIENVKHIKNMSLLWQVLRCFPWIYFNFGFFLYRRNNRNSIGYREGFKWPILWGINSVYCPILLQSWGIILFRQPQLFLQVIGRNVHRYVQPNHDLNFKWYNSWDIIYSNNCFFWLLIIVICLFNNQIIWGF